MDRDLIVALDFPSGDQAIDFLDHFTDPIFVKVGMELFYKEGPRIVEEIKKRGHKVFLDLKFHDIPNTVLGALKSTLDLDVDMVNLHIPAGAKAIRACKDLLEEEGKDTLLLGVTILTSMEEEDLKDLQIQGSLKDVVKAYGGLGLKAGLDGLVCSAQEVEDLKKDLGDFVAVTPGIRPSQYGADDQKRVMTPKDARRAGSDYIVVGRPIRQAADPVASYKAMREEFLREDL